MLTTTDSRKANTTMRRSNVICTERVSSGGDKATNPETAKYAKTTPRMPPAKPKIRLSVSN
jgi:hypothetical protein